ncbi:hypothetical protein D3C84_496890 [compost metagenome]
MDAFTQPAHLAARNEVQVLAVEFKLQSVFDTTNVADANSEERLIELVIGEIFLDAQLNRQGKVAADAVVCMEQPCLVNTSGTQFGLNVCVEFEALRQKIQTTALFTDLLITLVGFFVGLPGAHDFTIRHHHQRAAQLLAVTGAAGNVFEHTVAQLLALLDHAVDHQQWNQQQQNQQGNCPEF